MNSIGLVPVDVDGKWIGGRYYLQNIIKAVAALPRAEQLSMIDVWWQKKADEDPFIEVRQHLARSELLMLPATLRGRLMRKAKRIAFRTDGTADLFAAAGISALFPTSLCESPGIPFAFWIPDFQYRHYPMYFTEKMLLWYESYFEKNTERASRVVLSNTQALEEFKALYPDHAAKARMLHFCSVPDESWQKENPGSVARRKGIKPPYVIVSNQFSHHKNHHVLYEAARILRDRRLKVVLVCTGSTYGFKGEDYFASLKSFLETNNLITNVRVLGLIPRAEQIALMRGAEAVLQPSRFEGWSTSIEDAKSLGQRIIASDLPVHREQLVDYGRSQVLPLSDADAWANAIADALQQRFQGAPDQATLRETVNARTLRTGNHFVSIIREAVASR